MESTPHCNATPGDLDPGWSREKQDLFYQSVGSEITIAFGTEDSFDYGVGPLLQDLNSNGYTTESSNLSCSGSVSSHEPSLVFDEENPQEESEFVSQANQDLPDQWEAKMWDGPSGSHIFISHKEASVEQFRDDRRSACNEYDRRSKEFRQCIKDFYDSVDLEDYGFPSPEEREYVDQVFFRSVRNSYGV